MGPERMYSATVDQECPSCQNHLAVEFNFWEYPELALNYSEYSEEGCVVIEEPDYLAYLQPKDLDYEE